MLCFAAAAVVLDYDGESAQGAMSAILSFNDADCCRRRNFCSSFTYFAIFLQQPPPTVKINEDIVVGSVALDAQRKL